MLVYDVKQVPIHGGSLRIYATQAQGPYNEALSSVDQMLAQESAWGVETLRSTMDLLIKWRS